MLVIVKHWNWHASFQSFFDFKALWRFDIFKVDSTSGTTVTAQQEEKEDDMSVQESYTAEILRIAEESKQIKSAYWPLTHVCPSSVMAERLFSDAKHIMTEDRRYH